jgi:hypothetical protein
MNRLHIASLLAIALLSPASSIAQATFSDHLDIDYTEVFECVWDDSGSGADRDVGFFRPVPRPGYYALGHYASASHAMPHDVVTIVVKEKRPGALAPPLNYQLIWTDSGSGADDDGAVWSPSCPTNYLALGLVTSSGAKPSADAVRCVRQDLTAQAEVGDLIWNDAGSGAHSDFSAWSVEANGAPEGEAYVAPGTFIGHASHEKVSISGARALKLRLPVVPAPQSLPAPQLMGTGPPSSFQSQTTTSQIVLPFTAVKDPALSQARMARDSPYYRLVRKDRYKLIDHVYNTTDREQSFTWSYSIAIGNAETFTHQTGISLTSKYENKLTGYSVSATLSYSFTHEKSRSKEETTTIEVPVTASPGKAVAAFAVNSTFQLFRRDGSEVGVPANANEPNSVVFVQFPR